MNKLIAWWAKNPVAANLLMIAMFLSGLMGYLQMDREVFPTVSVNTVEVSIAWPGASVRDVEEQLVIRVESALKGLDHIDKIRSTALQGQALIEIKADATVDMSQFTNQIKLQIDSINSFPRDIEKPVISEVILRENTLRLALYGDVEELVLKRQAEKLRDDMRMLPAVNLVKLSGVRNEEVAIEISETALRRYKLTFDDIAQAVGNSSLNLSAGQIRTSQGTLQLRAQHLAMSQRDFEQIIIRQTVSGGILLLGDIAKVHDGFEDKQHQVTYNGQPAVLIDVMSTESMDVVKVSDTVKEWLQTVQPSLPPEMSLDIWLDTSDIYNSRMDAIGSSALSGLMLVVAVLFLSLRPKIAFWVGAGIATTYAASFALLPGNDVSINFLSTFAFLLVLGIVVDDAIVVGESIHEQSQEDGRGNLNNAIIGTQLVAKPVFYAVLTTMIAFVPWFFISGEDAQITRQISIVIICALIFSLLEAFFILPAHLSKLKPRRSQSLIFKTQQRIEHSIIKFAHVHYRRLATWVTKNALLTTCFFISLFIISVNLLGSGWVRFSFLPDIENTQIRFTVKFDDSTPPARPLAVLAQVREAHLQLQDPHTQIDKELAIVTGNQVMVTLDLSAREGAEMNTAALAASWREAVGDIPDAQTLEVYYKSNQVPALEFQINHPDLDQLVAAVADFKSQLVNYNQIYDIRDDLRSYNEELNISLLPGAEKLGLTLSEVVTQVRQAYYGQEVQRLPRNGNDVRVMVRYPTDSRRSSSSLKDMYVRTLDGREVPLLSVAKLSSQSGVQKIERRGGQRSATISAELHGDVQHEIQAELKRELIPQWQQRFPGVTLGEVGEAQSEKEFLVELLALYLIALFLMYALIAVAFSSYWQPLLIMVSIPFAFMGAVYGHLLYDIPMALFSYFGIGAAAGVVINVNLVLMDCVNKLKANGMTAAEAIVEGAVRRFRPIMLTSVTTFIGLLPMLAENSRQAQFLQPTVVSLAFGVLLAMVVTLLLVPALYVLVNSEQARLVRWQNAIVRRLGRDSALPQQAKPTAISNSSDL